jgi:transposase
VSGRYKTYGTDQPFLLPPSLREWLPEGHLAYFVPDVVDELDLAEIEKKHSSRLQGQPPYHPAMMVKLLFYAYCLGIPSSRKIERETYEDVAFRILAAGQVQDSDWIFFHWTEVPQTMAVLENTLGDIVFIDENGWAWEGPNFSKSEPVPLEKWPSVRGNGVS